MAASCLRLLKCASTFSFCLPSSSIRYMSTAKCLKSRVSEPAAQVEKHEDLHLVVQRSE